MGTMRKLKRQVRQNRRNAMKQYARTASVSIRAEKKKAEKQDREVLAALEDANHYSDHCRNCGLFLPGERGRVR